MFGEITKYIGQYAWWELAIFIIGILSFIAVLFILFMPLGHGPDKFNTTASVPQAGSGEFIELLSSYLSLPIEEGENIEILNNGDEFLSSFLSDVDNAKSSINIMLYIWEKGKMSDQIFEHLNNKLKEGVEVRIMLDDFGAMGARGRDEFKNFENLGGKVQVFRSLTIAPWDLLRNHKRNHQRAIAIDGEIGYFGGMAVNDHWLGDARNKEEWRDMMFRTTGKMANEVGGVFAQTWTGTSGEFLIDQNFYARSERGEPNRGTLTYIPVVSPPSPDYYSIPKFTLLSMFGAKKKIYITSPYFIPDVASLEVLIAKVKEGVDVRILVPNDFNDSKVVRYASQHSYTDLLKGGVKIYEYQPTFLHSKAIVIDGVWSIIGSANMDNRSRTLNSENIFGISDETFGAKLETIFLEDLEQSKEIGLITWEKRGPFQRFMEFSAHKFSYQF